MAERGVRKRIGALTHADFGLIVSGVPGHGPGVLWAAHHSAPNDADPTTRLIIRPLRGGGSEGTKGLPIDTLIRLTRERAEVPR